MKLLRNEFFIAFLLLIAYLLTNSYIYGWDDQHLEIPILKHLIDPNLYKGDYYVESLTKYFTSWLYPVLAKFITVKQVPAAYLVLFLISRYFMFYWVYRLWLLISGSCFAAMSATLMFFLLGRTEEFLYRSFCHEEFSFMFMFAGLYYFFRERYLAAALIFGLGVDTHAIYNLFPMLYMSAYLLVCHPKRFKMTFLAGLCFILTSLPFLCWQIPISLSREVAHPVAAQDWIPLYYLCCPQNFLFSDTLLKDVLGNIHLWWAKCASYFLLTGLFLFHLVFNQKFRRDHKVHAIFGVYWFLLGTIYYFDYVHPNRFVVDLNLVRVEQFVRFFMMGYTTIWAVEQIQTQKPWLALAAALLVTATGATDLVALSCLNLTAMIFSIDVAIRSPKSWRAVIAIIFCFAAFVLLHTLIGEIKNYPYIPFLWKKFMWILLGMAVVFVLLLFRLQALWLRRLLIIIPLSGAFISFCIYHYDYLQVKNHGAGFWQLQRNWEDMQRYVRDHTPKDAFLLTPYNMDMGGFRIHSERKVLVCYRDCGIVGFDYPAALEWQKRIKDIEEFKVYTDKPIDHAVITAIMKYKVDYIVFMNYYAPKEDNAIVKKIYQNEAFSLFQVLIKVP